MPGLLVRFPGRRYHATPWGHHVNEGLVEWPPSPWRILRALVSSGFTTQHWKQIPEAAAGLLEKFARSAPSYFLPPVSVAHSRHYMPIGVLKKGREDTTLVYDTWLDVGNAELEIHWDCELTQAETEKTLALDAENLTAHYTLALIYAQLGDEEKAAYHRGEHKKYLPDYNARDRAISIARRADPAADDAAQATVIYPLQRRGAPELDDSYQALAAMK